MFETGETTSKSGSWVNSGIHRDDNTDFYIVGNYQFFYVFDVKVLRRMEAKGEYLCKKETDTGQFFLLDQSAIEQDPPYIWKIKCDNEVKDPISKVFKEIQQSKTSTKEKTNES